MKLMKTMSKLVSLIGSFTVCTLFSCQACAEYYLVSSPDIVSPCYQPGCYRVHKPCRHRVVKHYRKPCHRRHRIIRPRITNRYSVSVYYYYPTIQPACVCTNDWVPCQGGCIHQKVTAPVYVQPSANIYYENTYDQDLRTDDDGGANLNIDN